MTQYAGMPEDRYNMRRMECGCDEIYLAPPVNGWRRFWTSECTIPEHRAVKATPTVLSRTEP